MAISNSVARIVGGSTMRAWLKLPVENFRERQTILKGQNLLNCRADWRGVNVLFVDEFSVVRSEQLVQSDVRLKRAKTITTDYSGGRDERRCLKQGSLQHRR